MKKSRKLGMYLGLLCTFALLAMTSCIKEDRDDCVTEQAGVTLRFRYTYNVTEGDAFGREADRVQVWIFDEGGKLLSQLKEEGEYIDNGFEMNIPDLGVGKYTFVAWAQETDSNDALSNFTFPELQAGTSTLTDLHARLNREENICRTELNGLLCGTVDGKEKPGIIPVFIPARATASDGSPDDETSGHFFDTNANVIAAAPTESGAPGHNRDIPDGNRC